MSGGLWMRMRETLRLRRRDGGRPVGRLEWRGPLVRRGGGVERVPLPAEASVAAGEGRVIMVLHSLVRTTPPVDIFFLSYPPKRNTGQGT